MIYLILFTTALAHLAFREDLHKRVDYANAEDFFFRRQEEWLLNFGLPDCEVCTNMADSWAFVKSDSVRLAKIDCADPLSQSLCIYFGLTQVPTIIRVSNGSYYFMPTTMEKTAENIQSFMETKFEDAFV